MVLLLNAILEVSFYLDYSPTKPKSDERLLSVAKGG